MLTSTNYFPGVAVPVPLNSGTTLVPREYIECGSCQYDIAVINLRAKDLKRLKLNVNKTYPLVEESSITSFKTLSSAYRVISEKEIFSNNFPAPSVMHLVDKIDGITEQYQDFPTYFETYEENSVSPNDLIGGPILQSSLSSNATYVVGMIRGIMRTSSDFYDNQKFFLSTMPHGYLRFIKKWLEVRHWKPDMYADEESGLHPRFDCYLSYPFAQINDSLCLCAKGWTNER